MTAIVTRGNAADLHLPDATVDLIVTSPPYFGLRSYQDGGEHYAGQVGDEATPAEYLDALTACTREWMRVLKPGGSIFVNLGDKYAGSDGSPGGASSSTLVGTTSHSRRVGQRGKRATGAPTKSLIGLPWRYALRCIDDLGLILRAEIVWSKPNGLPESVTDRVRRSHEQVFHFVKQPRYYSAVDEVREAQLHDRAQLKPRPNSVGMPPRGPSDLERVVTTPHPLGKLPGSVWTIPTAPLTVPDHLGVDHFAAYPPELVRRIVLGWSPREVCTACGEGRRPVLERAGGSWHDHTEDDVLGRSGNGSARNAAYRARLAAGIGPTLNGYACACPDTTAPTTPGVVLDPFMGTGTTCLVASCYGRVGIGVDLSADYVRLARWRTTDPGERARVLGVAKPPVQVDGQLGMFEDLTPTQKPTASVSLQGDRTCAACGYRSQYARKPACDRCGTERGAA